MSDELSHVGETGEARMVDVSDKPSTLRVARATGTIAMLADTLAAIMRAEVKKGDVLGVARVAGVMAAKRTAELIPLCHPLSADGHSDRAGGGSGVARNPRRSDGADYRPDGGGDGGADGGLGRLAHCLRHGEGVGSPYGDLRYIARGQVRWSQWRLFKTGWHTPCALS